MKRSIALTAWLFILASPLLAQTLTQKRLTVSSGGGVASDGIYTNTVIIGQTASGQTGDSIFSGGGGFLGGGDDWLSAIYDEPIIPLEFMLMQNYPNPFNPGTTIEYALARPGHVRMEVFNILGQRLTVLVDEYLEAGYHKYTWNASGVPTGVYFYRIRSGDFEKTRKMLLLK